MRKTHAFFVALALWAPSVVAGQESPAVEFQNGFVTGNVYRTLSEEEKAIYASGVIDGMFFSPVLRAPRERVQWLERCTLGMTSDQVAAIVDRFVAAHPERWHQPMNLIVFSAMKEACPKATKP